MKHPFTPIFVAALAATLNPAHAGVTEDLLAIPGIQSRLGRQPELKPCLGLQAASPASTYLRGELGKARVGFFARP